MPGALKAHPQHLEHLINTTTKTWGILISVATKTGALTEIENGARDLNVLCCLVIFKHFFFLLNGFPTQKEAFALKVF